MRSLFGLAVFLAVFAGTLFGLHLYIFVNLAAAGLPRGPTAAALAGLAGCILLSLPFSRFAAKGLPGALVRACHWLGMTWMGTGFLM